MTHVRLCTWLERRHCGPGGVGNWRRGVTSCRCSYVVNLPGEKLRKTIRRVSGSPGGVTIRAHPTDDNERHSWGSERPSCSRRLSQYTSFLALYTAGTSGGRRRPIDVGVLRRESQIWSASRDASKQQLGGFVCGKLRDRAVDEIAS